MKNNLPTSEEKLTHALLSEDARLPNQAPDQELLDAVSAQIDQQK